MPEDPRSRTAPRTPTGKALLDGEADIWHANPDFWDQSGPQIDDDKLAAVIVQIEAEAAEPRSSPPPDADLEAKAWWEPNHGDVVLLSDATDALELAAREVARQSRPDAALRTALEAEHYGNLRTHKPGFAHGHPGAYSDHCGICAAKLDCATCSILEGTR